MASGKHFLFFSSFFSFIHSFFIFPLGIIIKVSTHRQKPRIFAFLFATSQACQTYINIGRGKLIAHRPPFFFSYSRHNNNPTSFSLLLLLLLLLLYFSVFSTYHICIFTFYFLLYFWQHKNLHPSKSPQFGSRLYTGKKRQWANCRLLSQSSLKSPSKRFIENTSMFFLIFF